MHRERATGDENYQGPIGDHDIEQKSENQLAKRK